MSDFLKPTPARYHGQIIDAHLHLRPAETMRTFLEVAEAYGVRSYVGIGDLEALASCRKALPGRVTGVLRLNWDDLGDPQCFKERTLAELSRAVAREDVRGVKFWFTPEFHARTGLWFDDAQLDFLFDFIVERRLVALVHVGDPDAWFERHYTDAARYGTKAENLAQLERRMRRHPGLVVQAAHLGGDPEHLDRLARVLDEFPNLHLDLSATKWLARELSRKPDEARPFVIAHSARLLWGSDLVVARRPDMTADDYATRYYVHRHLWEGRGWLPSPIPDADAEVEHGQPSADHATRTIPDEDAGLQHDQADSRRVNLRAPPGGGAQNHPPCTNVMVAGLDLPTEVQEKIYCRNAAQLYGLRPV